MNATSQLLCLLAGLAGMTLWAQENRAALGGRVIDPQAAVVPGATVVVTSEETRVKQQTTTNGAGEWKMPFLNPGPYNILVTAEGFKTAERKGITLQTADIKQIDIALEVGANTERVTVTAEAELIDTTSATSGTVITPEAVAEMPSLSRVPTLLAGMSPGVLLLDQNQNLVNMWSYNGASDIRVNGGRDNRSNEFLLDGMPNQHGEKVAFIPPTDAVSEFRIMSNAYDAQYGRQAGATINMSVKNGSNNYHGNLYEFLRNTALNANYFQTNLVGGSKPPTHFNLYGGTFGGPVWLPKVYQGKEKTFFFISYEGTRNKDPRFGIRSVPLASERAGDFTQSYAMKTGDPVHYPIIIYDPLTTDSATTRRVPFPENRIPTARMSPIALKIMSFVPLPNKPTETGGSTVNNFVPDNTRQNKMASLTLRLDHSFNNSNKSFVSIRWNHEDEILDNYYHNVSTGGGGSRNNQGIGLDHVWTISPYKILNLRFNITRFEEPTFNSGSGFQPADLGFSKDFVSQMEKFSFPRIEGVFSDIGGGYGSFTGFSYYNWNANLTHVHGSMVFHYGGEFRVLQEARSDYGNQSGRFSFSDLWTRQRYNAGDFGTGANLASFLLGLPNGGDFPRNANRLNSQRYIGFYFQNDWRITPKLTVNLGLRWDVEQPWRERFNRMTSEFDPTVLNPISDAAQAAYTDILNNQVLKDPVKYPFGAQLAQLVPASSFKVYGVQYFAGVDGHRPTATNYDWNQWQPRAGFAYRIRPTTVLRGGFGRFTQSADIKGGQNGFSRSTPFTRSLDSDLTPYDTMANPFRAGILAPTGSSLGALTNLGQGVNFINQDPTHPYSWEYSVHLQHQYKQWLFEAGYSHNKTYHIYWGLDQNLQTLDQWKTMRVPRFDARGKPLESTDNISNHAFLWDDAIPNPFRNLPGVSGGISTAQFRSIGDLLRPLKLYGGLNRDNNPWGKNQYDALLVKIERRFRKGFSLIAAYTLSKLFEDTAFWGPEITGPITEHKLGGEDRPHMLNIAPIWEIPVGRGKKFGDGMPKVLDFVVGGWELSGSYRIQSGTPVVIGSNYFFDGQEFAIPRDQQSRARWFDTSRFVRYPGRSDDIAKWPAWTGVQNLPGASFRPTQTGDPANGVYQDFGAVIWRLPTRWAHVRNDRVNEANIGIFKNFKVRERVKAQFRCEAFNAFNHPRFGGPDSTPSSSRFGVVTPAQQNLARIVQAALKVSF
jgi:hypothetical protein